MRSKLAGAFAVILLAMSPAAMAEDKPLMFGVVNQRSPILTAQYWNPILRYVSEKSGIPLQLKMGKTAPDHSAMIKRKEFDLVYSNHIFSPENESAGYKVFTVPAGGAIAGQIVVLANSMTQSLADLQEQEVGFPSAVAFVGYYVPMDALLRAGIQVKPVFAGNQEGAMGQLKAGRVVAAAVNSQVMRDFAARENIQYRILWSSEDYLNIPIAALPSLPKERLNAIRAAFLGMARDPEGLKVLQASGELIKQPPPYGFVAADDRQFDNYRQFFKNTLVKAE
ncbi:MAG TPA: phosphate/phosphite/phosphonate ABC transporter substrate-binding protein [Burkholderiales bacterium]|nr:phosphate/phosphite/phosphonate ABC transporter substrate-binding protein [Burkholderiales bacterium]